MRRLRPWRQWTVRSRMAVSVVALAAVALLAANAAGVILLRSYLLNRVDAQLDEQSRVPRWGLRPGGGTGNRPPMPNFGPRSRIYVYQADGTLLYTSDPTGRSLLDSAALARHAARSRPYTTAEPDGDWRIRVRRQPGDGNGYAVLAVSLREAEATGDRLIMINATVSAAVLLLMGVVAATVVRIGLRPLTRMQRTAADIAAGDLSAGDLSRRVVDADPHTEAGRLGLALNTMLARIEESELRRRQFLADAAHELRTPLTSIQGYAELYRRGGLPPGPELTEAMTRITDEAARMRLLVNDLMLLARLDSERPLERNPVDLLAVAADAVRDAHLRVPDRFVQLSGLDDVFEPVTVLGDEPRLRQVVANLVTNALQHTSDTADVVVRVGRLDPDDEARDQDGKAVVVVGAEPAGPLAVVEVADTGPGLAAEHAARVFERLYRADPSRSRQHGGAGLGLSIVAAIVQAHHGRVELRTAPQRGARFRVLLPLPADTVQYPHEAMDCQDELEFLAEQAESLPAGPMASLTVHRVEFRPAVPTKTKECP